MDTEISELEHVENDLKAKIKENEDLNLKIEELNDKISELSKSLEKEKSENISIVSSKNNEISELKNEIRNCINMFYYNLFE